MFLQKESLRKTQDKTDALYLKCFSIIQNICTNEKYSGTQNRLHFKVFHPRKITKKNENNTDHEIKQSYGTET